MEIFHSASAKPTGKKTPQSSLMEIFPSASAKPTGRKLPIQA